MDYNKIRKHLLIKELCEATGVSRSTVHMWRCSGTIPEAHQPAIREYLARKSQELSELTK